MDARYFERVHTQEARHAEWRLLDEALSTRNDHLNDTHQSLRVVIGHLMMRAGARIAGEKNPKQA